jgi:hypothetical protein
VRRYLMRTRCVPPALFEPLVKAGTLYAEARGNAVFLLLDEAGLPVGAELRGTTAVCWRGMAPGSQKHRGFLGRRPECFAGDSLRVRHRLTDGGW